VTDGTSPKTPAGLDRLLVIGIGTEHRGDDRCGLDVVRRLRAVAPGSARFAECTGDITELLDLWSGAREAIVVDAIRSGRPVGAVVRVEVPPEEPPIVAPASTHGLSLAEAIGLGRTLGQMPPRLVIYGIEAGNLDMGDRLSPAVSRGVRDVVDRLARELRARSSSVPRS
jgi:hydrogenase maturation protease